MSIPTFEFKASTFTYHQKDGGDCPSVVAVEFVPLGGKDFGVNIRLDGDLIDQYRHSGSFTSKNAAEYCLAGIATWSKEGRTILTPAANAPIITLKSKDYE